MRRRAILLLGAVAATLVLASGVALAVNKVCNPGTTEANPCLGTKGHDILIGITGERDYIKALSGNDKISGGEGVDEDTTDGGTGNDTYSYGDDWGHDTLLDASGFDTLNFSAVSLGIIANLAPDTGVNPQNQVFSSQTPCLEESCPDGRSRVDVSLSPVSVIEKVVGSASGNDGILTGGAANILEPGPGKGGADLADVGGCTNIVNYCEGSFPASDDTYSGFRADGYGGVTIQDFGGKKDKLILPFASTDVLFLAEPAFDGTVYNLVIASTSTDYVQIYGQFKPVNGRQGIEKIIFTDGVVSIGEDTQQAQTFSETGTAGSAETQVEKLNEASTLDESEKEKLSEAVKKLIAEDYKVHVP